MRKRKIALRFVTTRDIFHQIPKYLEESKRPLEIRVALEARDKLQVLGKLQRDHYLDCNMEEIWDTHRVMPTTMADIFICATVYLLCCIFLYIVRSRQLSWCFCPSRACWVRPYNSLLCPPACTKNAGTEAKKPDFFWLQIDNPSDILCVLKIFQQKCTIFTLSVIHTATAEK